ncbi:MAG: hypothetical protein JW751_17105 [Polyangiaceae bacterium]|nr:hypothetical protein [Polyangiaceae bacterium]
MLERRELPRRARRGHERGFPEDYGRFDWATVDGSLDFCRTAFAAESIEDALATRATSASDPGNAGCGGFAWSELGYD